MCRCLASCSFLYPKCLFFIRPGFVQLRKGELQHKWPLWPGRLRSFFSRTFSPRWDERRRCLFSAIGRPAFPRAGNFSFRKLKKTTRAKKKGRARALCAKQWREKRPPQLAAHKKRQQKKSEKWGREKIHGGRRPESNRGLLHPKQEFYHLTTAPPVDISPEAFFRPPPVKIFFHLFPPVRLQTKKEKKNNRPFSQEKECVAFYDGASWRRRCPRL